MGDSTDLVAAARAGDREAFAVLVARYRPMLLALCRRMLPGEDAAEDAAQEAVVLALVELDRLRDPERFGAWLAGIGVNVCRQWLRLRHRAPWSWPAALGGRAVTDSPDHAPSPAELAEQRELAALVRQAVGTLPAGQRSAVALYYLGGLSHREAASTLGISVGSVKTRLHKARANLRRHLEALREEPVMQPETNEPVVMRITGVHRARSGEGEGGIEEHVVLLEEEAGDRRLPIWIGPFEATGIALSLEAVELPRPGPWQMAARLLEASGTRVRRVLVNQIAGGTFYAEVHLVDASEGAVDARPSDALNLALVTGAPIVVAPEVLQAIADQEGDDPERAAGAILERSEATAADIARQTVARWERSWPPRT